MKKYLAFVVLFVALFALSFPALASERSTPVAATVYSEVVTLTDAQIKSLPSSPVEILPSPGADKMILPVSVVVKFENSGNYTDIAPTATLAIVHYGYGLLASLSEGYNSGVSNLLANDADMFSVLNPQSSISPTMGMRADYNYPEYFADQGLTLILYNGFNGDLEGGDSTNALTITVYYVIIDL